MLYLIIVLFVLLLGIIIYFDTTLYCYIFNHKDWVLWVSVCKNLSLAKFKEHYINEEKPDLECYNFYIHDIGIGKPVKVIYWVKSDNVSVHTDEGCILSPFDKYHSNKAADIIKHDLI